MTGDIRVIPIVEHDEYNIQWMYDESISTDSGVSNTLKEEKSRPIRHLWKMSAISEINNFMSKKA